MPLPLSVDNAEKGGLLDADRSSTRINVSPAANIFSWTASACVAWFEKHERAELGQLSASSTALTAANRIPTKRMQNRVSQKVRFDLWFNTYRKLFVFITTCNVFGILLSIINKWRYPRQNTSAFILGNFLVAILVRNEFFGRLLYLSVNTLFAKWPPLKFRLACTSALQHLGGIHSGCATSGFFWLIFRVASIYKHRKHSDDSVLFVGSITTLAVGVSIVAAIPWIRNNHHDVFERYHRFVGWLALLATWLFVVLSDSYNLESHRWRADGYRIQKQDFWLVFGMTAFVVTPWLTVREVRVYVESPSPKVAIIRFERGMQQGLLARIGRGAIMEYHAFGIVSEGIHSKEHYLICGVQGDFTRDLVENPPSHLWTRELKFASVSNACPIFRRGIRVCTGTGLGAALSTCLQSPDWYLIWIGSDLEKTFGSTIMNLIRKSITPDRRLLWDTKKRGRRPDVMELIKQTYYTWGAEVVFITSNWQGNQEMMEGCKEANIPAFGVLWDF